MVVVRRRSCPGIIEGAGERARKALPLGEGERLGEDASKVSETADCAGIGDTG